MNNKFRKLMAAALTVCTVSSFAMFGASAAEGPETYADGEYTAKLTLMHETKPEASMASAAFDADMELVVDGDSTQVIVYGFLPTGDPSTPPVKNFHLMLNEEQLMAQIPEGPLVDRVADYTKSLFKITAGETYPAQRMVFNIATSDIAQLTAGVMAGANPTGMPRPVAMRFSISGITPVSVETSRQTMQLTAAVAPSAPNYSVVIPDVLGLGRLTDEYDNTITYPVTVNATNLQGGSVVVEAPESGSLTSGSHSLAYTNSFGRQTTSASAELDGTFTVAADAVAHAASGDYVGYVTFTIGYIPA